jgi:hypothetical protein
MSEGLEVDQDSNFAARSRAVVLHLQGDEVLVCIPGTIRG